MTAEETALAFIAYVIAFIIGVFITRAIFSIPKFIRMKKVELKILSEIAKKSGVEPDKINGIFAENNIK